MTVKKSIYFRDTQGKKCYLFRVLNYGEKDNLKFIFHPKNQGLATVYSSDSSFTSSEDVIVLYSEITYHNDGNLQNKLFQNRNYKEGDDRIKKVPLEKMDDWEPIIKYNVVDYNLCRKMEPSDDDVFLPENSTIFNGEPFECIFCLIHMKYMSPSTDEKDDIVFRINDVARNVDLLLFIRKSSYRGVLRTIPNTGVTFWDTNNLITKVKRNKH